MAQPNQRQSQPQVRRPNGSSEGYACTGTGDQDIDNQQILQEEGFDEFDPVRFDEIIESLFQ